MPTRSKSGSAKSKARKSHQLKTLSTPNAVSSKVTGGKRTVVKDSHDKYANTDTNY